MRKALAIAALAATICLLAGCDFLRSLAGRPTSRDIDAKRAQIEREVAPEKEHADSLAAGQLADAGQPDQQEPAVKKDPAPTSGGGIPKQLTPKQLQGREKFDLAHRYYLMIGVFRNPDNATRQSERAQAAGYPVTLIPMNNGLTGVGVCASDDLQSVYESFVRLRKEPFCPDDTWILNNE